MLLNYLANLGEYIEWGSENGRSWLKQKTYYIHRIHIGWWWAVNAQRLLQHFIVAAVVAAGCYFFGCRSHHESLRDRTMKGNFSQLACRRSSSGWWPVYLPYCQPGCITFFQFYFIYYTRTCELLCMFARMLSKSESQHHCRRDVPWHLLCYFVTFLFSFSFFNICIFFYVLCEWCWKHCRLPKRASFLPVYAMYNFIGSFIIRVALWTLHLSPFLTLAVRIFFCRDFIGNSSVANFLFQ